MNRPNYKEVLEYIEMKGITVEEAYDAFCRMGRPPLVKTMKAVFRRVAKSQWCCEEKKEMKE